MTPFLSELVNIKRRIKEEQQSHNLNDTNKRRNGSLKMISIYLSIHIYQNKLVCNKTTTVGHSVLMGLTIAGTTQLGKLTNQVFSE